MPCGNCPLTGCRTIEDPKPGKTGLLIVTDSPRQADIAKKTLLSGKEGELVKTVLSEFGVSDWKAVSAVNCLLPDKKAPSRKEISMCRGRLLEAMKACDPDKIAVLGNSACLAVFDSLKDRGKLLDWNGVPAVFTYAPGAVMANDRLFSEWVSHLEKLVRERTSKWEDYEWEVLDTENKAALYMAECLKKPKAALDYETTSLNPFGSKKDPKAKPVCLTMSNDGRKAVLIPAELIHGRVLNLFKAVCESKVVIGSNFADYDWKISYANYGIKTKFVDDTVIMHYLLNENSGENGLKQLSQLYLNAPDWETPMKPWIKKMAECPMSVLGPYATCDAIASFRLGEYLEKRLREENLMGLYTTLFRQSIPLLAEMSCHGVRMDLNAIESLKETLGSEIERLKTEIRETAGKDVLPTSPKQLAEYFFTDKRYYAPERSKKTGNPSVGAKTRKFLIDKYDDQVAKLLNEFFDASKLKSTYVDGLSERLDSEGRIHAHFLLQITATGRLSGRDPNLQNIPKRKESGKKIRELFVPDEGCLFFDCDYSNLEVRVGAMESEDPILTEMINSGIDVHKRVASMIYGVPEDEVTFGQRTMAKTGTFGVMYGMTFEGASYRLGLSKDDAVMLVMGVKEIFRGLADWAERMQKFALENGYVVSRVGRVRRFPLIADMKDVESVKRKAVNTPIQSLASDICLNACHNLKKELGGILVPQILVHDSICGSIRKVDPETVESIKRIMCKLPFPTKVRFDVDCSFGPNWGSVKTYGGETWPVS